MRKARIGAVDRGVLVAGTTLAVLALVACSDGEWSNVVGPVAEVSPDAEKNSTPTAISEPVPSATHLPPTRSAEGRTAEVATDKDEDSNNDSISDNESTAEPYDRYAITPEPPMTATLPTVEFPHGIVLLAHQYRMVLKGGSPSQDLVRTYRDGNGGIVKELLFAGPDWSHVCGDNPGDYYAVDYSDIQTLTGQLPECGGHYDMTARPDGSSIVMTVCVEPWCGYPLPVPDLENPPGRTAIYESQDGGVTWGKLADFDVPWIASRILPAGDGETRLLLTARRPFDHEEFPYPILWLDGEIEQAPDPPPPPEGYNLLRGAPMYLDDGRFAWHMYDATGGPMQLYLTAEGEDVTELVLAQLDQEEECWQCLMLPDGRVLLLEYYDAEELIGPYGAAEGRVGEQYYIPWPTIWDLKTGEQWPVILPYNVLNPRYALTPLAAQQGPFFPQVVGIDEGCLPIRAEASHDSEELICMAEGVLVTDLDESVERKGTTWRSVRTPAGLKGWANGRHLEYR